MADPAPIRKTTTLKLTAEIVVPQVPNYLRYGSHEAPIDVAHLSDADLRHIGEAWTQALIDRANHRRSLEEQEKRRAR
jgi:hypothetical protein